MRQQSRANSDSTARMQPVTNVSSCELFAEVVVLVRQTKDVEQQLVEPEALAMAVEVLGEHGDVGVVAKHDTQAIGQGLHKVPRTDPVNASPASSFVGPGNGR